MRKLFVDLFKFVANLAQSSERASRSFSKCVCRFDGRILSQKSNAATTLESDRSSIGLRLPGKQSHQRALSATISPNEPDLFTRFDGQHCSIKEEAGSMSKADIRQRGNRHFPILHI